MIVIMNRGAGGPEDPQARIVELFASLGETPRILQPTGDKDISAVAREARELVDLFFEELRASLSTGEQVKLSERAWCNSSAAIDTPQAGG